MASFSVASFVNVGFIIKGHKKMSPKLVKMSVLNIKINFSQRCILMFPRNKITVVLELALLASQMEKICHSFNRES